MILPLCNSAHPIILPPCNPANPATFAFHPGILSPWYPFTLSPWYPFTPFTPGILSPWYPFTFHPGSSFQRLVILSTLLFTPSPLVCLSLPGILSTPGIAFHPGILSPFHPGILSRAFHWFTLYPFTLGYPFNPFTLVSLSPFHPMVTVCNPFNPCNPFHPFVTPVPFYVFHPGILPPLLSPCFPASSPVKFLSGPSLDTLPDSLTVSLPVPLYFNPCHEYASNSLPASPIPCQESCQAYPPFPVSYSSVNILSSSPHNLPLNSLSNTLPSSPCQTDPVGFTLSDSPCQAHPVKPTLSSTPSKLSLSNRPCQAHPAKLSLSIRPCQFHPVKASLSSSPAQFPAKLPCRPITTPPLTTS
nr:proline-rich protein 36-like [Penaeus vannamei]